MEPDSLKELLSEHITKVLQQNPYTSQSHEVQEYLKTMATLSMVADDSASTDWIITKQFQQPICIDYEELNDEDLNDKDLGIVRKINLK